MINRIDHFAIGAASLEQGAKALEAALGVAVPRGGKHEAMSTHNCVARAGENCFLEILSIDPDAPPPPRRRWFTLDEESTRARLAERPRALCWVVNTDDLDGVLANSPLDLGQVVHFTRGARSWRLTVPKDGSLPETGLLPAFIEWSPGPHPSSGMADLGLTLEKVKLSHPSPTDLARLLERLGVDHLAEVGEGPRALAFQVAAPAGRVTLD